VVRPPRTTIQTWFPRLGLGHKSQTRLSLPPELFLHCPTRIRISRGLSFPSCSFYQTPLFSVLLGLAFLHLELASKFAGSSLHGFEFECSHGTWKFVDRAGPTANGVETTRSSGNDLVDAFRKVGFFLFFYDGS